MISEQQNSGALLEPVLDSQQERERVPQTQHELNKAINQEKKGTV